MDQPTKQPTLCMMPFVHQHVTQQGTVTPCCVAPWEAENAFGHVDDASLADIWKGEKMNAFRAKMLSGEPDKRCSRCYEKEKTGTKSLRNIINTRFEHHLERVRNTNSDGKLGDEYKPVYYDLRFSNVCNYRCRICGPWSSSKWHKDGLALGMTQNHSALSTPTENMQSLFDQFEANINNVEEVYFAGGEPLMMDEHYRLLEMMIDHGKSQVRLTYNTNFSTFLHKHWNVLELWQKFEHINVAASLDAMGPRAELLRKEQDWEQVVSNLELLRRQAPHVELVITPTVCNLNVLHLPDFHQFLVEEGYIIAENFMPHVLIQPEYYNIRCLPFERKQKVLKRLQEHQVWISKQVVKDREKADYSTSQFLSLVDHMMVADHSHLIPELRKRSKALDILRDESTLAVFPELSFLKA